MTQFDFDTFTAEARTEGFDETLVRQWDPLTEVDTHSHPFTLKALVVQGEMWLTVGREVRHLHPGDAFSLAFNEPHAERYGAEGATYWVARRAS